MGHFFGGLNFRGSRLGINRVKAGVGGWCYLYSNSVCCNRHSNAASLATEILLDKSGPHFHRTYYYSGRRAPVAATPAIRNPEAFADPSWRYRGSPHNSDVVEKGEGIGGLTAGSPSVTVAVGPGFEFHQRHR